MNIVAFEIGVEKDTRLFNGDVGGKPSRAYVDLGSDVVTKRKSEADKIGIIYNPSQEVLGRFGRSRVWAYGEAMISLKVDLVKRDILAYVVPDSAQETRLVAGQSMMQQPGVVVSQKNDTLRFFEDELCVLPQ